MSFVVQRSFAAWCVSVSLALAACSSDLHASADLPDAGLNDAGDAGDGGGGGRAAGSGAAGAGGELSASGSGGRGAAAGRGAAGAGGRAGAGSGGAGRGGTGGAPAVSACPAQMLAPGDTTKMLQHAGANRRYLLHVPPSYDGTKQVPLVIDLHGWTYTDADQATSSGWREKSDEEGFIVAYPNGLDKSWNGGAVCCGSSQEAGVDDQGFARAVVEQLSRDGCIDRKRVYATGLSNGAALTYMLGCRAADVFAAIAPVSIGNGTSPCEPARPISVVMFRGTADELVPYAGSDEYPAAMDDLTEWATLNSCAGEPTRVSGVCDRYTQCAGGAEVLLCSIGGGEHLLYQDAAMAGAAVPDVAWSVFARHSL